MPRLSINEMTTYRWSFEMDVIRYAAAGISAMGVWRQKLSDYGEEKGAELLRETGMNVSNLLWAGGFTGSDGRTWHDAVQDAQDAIRLAEDLGTRVLVVYSGARGGHTHRHAQRLFVSALRALLPLAAQHDVTLAIEPMHEVCATEWTFLNSLSETVDLIETIDDPHLGLVLDTYHFGQDERLLDQIPAITPRIAVVHLGDARRPPSHEQNRCPLGQGTIALAEIVEGLSAAGYEGDYDVELLGEDVEAITYETLLADSQAAFGHLASQRSST